MYPFFSFGIESDGQLGRDHIENLGLLPFERWLGAIFLRQFLTNTSYCNLSLVCLKRMAYLTSIHFDLTPPQSQV